MVMTMMILVMLMVMMMKDVFNQLSFIFSLFYLSIYRLKHHLLPCLIGISIDSKINSSILIETNKLHYIQKYLKFYILLSEKYKSSSASIKEDKNHGNSCSSKNISSTVDISMQQSTVYVREDEEDMNDNNNNYTRSQVRNDDHDGTYKIITKDITTNIINKSDTSSSSSSKNDNQAIINDEIIQMARFSQSLPVDLLPIAAISLL